MTTLTLPTNLAYSRSITPSVAAFFSFDSENPNHKQAISVEEVTSIGTVSNYKDIHKDDGKNVENSNPQTIDTCHLPLEHDSFEMSFTVAFSSGSMQPHSCNEVDFRQALNDLTQAYKEIGGYKHLAKLYLNNILAAKMLWRNGLADDISVKIDALRTDIATITNVESDLHDLLINEISSALSGERKRLVLKISISAWLGNGQEVFPSQEFSQKSNEKCSKSKTLARIKLGTNFDVAAMHPQKIGNAIRQIDSWYDGFETLQKPLAIDPACVNKSEFKPYRPKASKRDLYTLFQKKTIEFIEQTKSSENVADLDNDIHFVVANLIRGGVFGGK